MQRTTKGVLSNEVTVVLLKFDGLAGAIVNSCGGFERPFQLMKLCLKRYDEVIFVLQPLYKIKIKFY